jgi:hypothetical protein
MQHIMQHLSLHGKPHIVHRRSRYTTGSVDIAAASQWVSGRNDDRGGGVGFGRAGWFALRTT